MAAAAPVIATLRVSVLVVQDSRVTISRRAVDPGMWPEDDLRRSWSAATGKAGKCSAKGSTGDDMNWRVFAQQMATMARDLLAQDPVDATLRRITESATELVEGCDAAGVLILRGTPVETLALTDQMVVERLAARATAARPVSRRGPHSSARADLPHHRLHHRASALALLRPGPGTGTGQHDGLPAFTGEIGRAHV